MNIVPVNKFTLADVSRLALAFHPLTTDITVSHSTRSYPHQSTQTTKIWFQQQAMLQYTKSTFESTFDIESTVLTKCGSNQILTANISYLPAYKAIPIQMHPTSFKIFNFQANTNTIHSTVCRIIRQSPYVSNLNAIHISINT